MAKTKLSSLVSIESARSAWDKIITTTPVVLTVIATILAGLSSSESNLAQYHRALSAQNQAKAADQWAFYQAKRTRQSEAENTLALMAMTTGAAPAGADAVQQLSHWINRAPTSAPAADHSKTSVEMSSTRGASAAQYLATGVPTAQDEPIDQPVASAMALLGDNKDASNIVKTLDQKEIDGAIAQAERNADRFDQLTKPITAFIDSLAGLAAESVKDAGPAARDLKPLAANLAASKLSWDARRNAAEALYNQTVAQVLEVQVAYSSQDSDRHRDRSKFFFYGMLAAQAGVTISTLSLAVKNRNALWIVAALVGMAAVAYAAYIYVFT